VSLNPSSATAFQLDLNDPHVREMADLDHVPTEAWTAGGYVSVTCCTCGREWPCFTRRQLRALEAKEAKSG
jgi:hypothetical protein